MRHGARKALPGASGEDDRDEHEGAIDDLHAPDRFRQQAPSAPHGGDELVRRGLSADFEAYLEAGILQATIRNKPGLRQMFDRLNAGL